MCPLRVSRIYFPLSSEYQDICSHPALFCLSFYQLHWQGFPDVTCKGISASWDLHLILNGQVLRFFFFPSLLFGVSISSKPCTALLIPVQKCFSSGDNEENLFPTKASLTPHPRDPFLCLFLSLNITDIFPFYILSKSQFIKGFTGSPPSLPFNVRACQVLSAEPHWFLQRSLCPRSFCSWAVPTAYFRASCLSCATFPLQVSKCGILIFL